MLRRKSKPITGDQFWLFCLTFFGVGLFVYLLFTVYIYIYITTEVSEKSEKKNLIRIIVSILNS